MFPVFNCKTITLMGWIVISLLISTPSNALGIKLYPTSSNLNSTGNFLVELNEIKERQPIDTIILRKQSLLNTEVTSNARLGCRFYLFWWCFL